MFHLLLNKISTMPLLNHVILGNSISNYLFFFAILILGLAFKRIFSNSLSKLFFRLFEGSGGGTNPNNGLVFISLLLRPIELLIMSIACYLAINQLNYPLNEVLFSRQITKNNTLSHYEVTVIDIVDKLFLFFLILSVFWIILRIIDSVAHAFTHKSSLSESKTDDQIVPFVKELSKITTIIIGAFTIMGIVFNLNVATIIAGLGVGGIAIGLAAQDTLKNLLGSFTIFADKPFVVGDNVRIDKYEGTIEKVGFRSTLLRTIDKTLVIIPNNRIINDLLENLTLRNLRRVKFSIGLQYDTPSAKMIAISKEVVEFVNKHHATSNDALVNFDSFGESSLDLQIRYYIEIVDYDEYMQIREEVNYKIMDIVARHDAHFAFPSRTVYIEHPTDKEKGSPK